MVLEHRNQPAQWACGEVLTPCWSVGKTWQELEAGDWKSWEAIGNKQAAQDSLSPLQ